MEENESYRLPIRTWAEDDRPREKLITKGRQALSNAELLAILIRSGSRELSAVDLAKRLLAKAGNDLNRLARFHLADFKDPKNLKGLGVTKAITIMAALELGARRKAADALDKLKIINSQTVYEVLHPRMADLTHEEFWVICLNRANKILAIESISKGGVSGTVADVRIIFRRAVELLASSIILAHNHPSGNKRPSEQDKALTRKMKEAGKIMDIAVLDHLIITADGYFSFADEGLI
ncbi:MAG: DNA repair protein RadC [Chitinophagales bacterium]|nr:MAG: DNA repair protein RadC [Chitinophagales bacterium]